MLIGYARVSSDDQNLNLQKDGPEAGGIERRPRLCTRWGYADCMATGSAQPISQGSY